MNDKQNAQHKTQQPLRDPAALRSDRNEQAARQEPSERRPSKIERREWRGAGVCGDRHTD
jgi:hypothetical protein